jgi:hypothetical protein
MKKTRLAILAVLVLVFTMAFPLVASAATVDDITAALSETITTAGGQTVSIGAAAINEARTQAAPLSAATLDAVLAQINAAKASVRAATGTLDAASLQALVSGNITAAYNAVLADPNHLANLPSLTAVLNNYGGSIDGVVYGGNPLAQTGVDYSALTIFAGIAVIVIAAGIAVARRHRLFAAE